MCVRIWRDNDTIDTPRQLADLVGGLDNVVHYPLEWMPWGDVHLWEAWADYCLCGVDMRRTLDAAGVAYEEDGGSIPGDLVILERP